MKAPREGAEGADFISLVAFSTQPGGPGRSMQ
jgi:hypothetical protein